MAEVEWPESPVRDGGGRHQDSHSGSLAVSNVEPMHSSWLSHTWGNSQNKGGHSQEATSKWELRNIQLAASSHSDKNQHTKQKIKSKEQRSYPATEYEECSRALSSLHTRRRLHHWIILSDPTSYCYHKISSHTEVERLKNWSYTYFKLFLLSAFFQVCILLLLNRLHFNYFPNGYC